MKKLFGLLIVVLLVVGGVVVYRMIQKGEVENQLTSQSLSGKTLLPVGFPLKSGYELYMEFGDAIVPIGRLFVLEVSTGSVTQIKDINDLSRIVGRIETEEQALAFVEFFTSYPTKFLLEKNPMSGIDANYALSPYGQTPSPLASLLTTTTVESREGRWIIQRDLLMYPGGPGQIQRTAQLVRSHETISRAGVYNFEIDKVITEGDDLDKYLPYYE